jgi:pSer/pThr/pTyr-binding forkhead associated (FHA) protein
MITMIDGRGETIVRHMVVYSFRIASETMSNGVYSRDVISRGHATQTVYPGAMLYKKRKGEGPVCTETCACSSMLIRWNNHGT